MSETAITKKRVVSSYQGKDDDTRASGKQSNKDSTVGNKGGRPTLYSLEIALEICDRIADGESLVKICSDAKMPKKTAVYEWLLTTMSLVRPQPWEPIFSQFSTAVVQSPCKR